MTLPNGETIEAATPELAKAMRDSINNDNAAAVYQEAGIDTSHGESVDPDQVQPGDWARYDDGSIRVAAGPGKVLNNGQVVDVTSSSGETDGFEGWYSPPDSGGDASSSGGTTDTTVTASKHQ
ncbi:hypothetical protein LT337_32010 (plasmid) [Mycolicibacterium fortuitum]|nr:hypothetical protein LT337_32010 [Mycolicibacterium fortuitum]